MPFCFEHSFGCVVPWTCVTRSPCVEVQSALPRIAGTCAASLTRHLLYASARNQRGTGGFPSLYRTRRWRLRIGTDTARFLVPARLLLAPTVRRRHRCVHCCILNAYIMGAGRYTTNFSKKVDANMTWRFVARHRARYRAFCAA